MKLSPQSRGITIALDIDDLLTSMEVRSLRDGQWLDPVHHCSEHFFVVQFEHDGCCYELENVLTPGCLELLQFLFAQDDVRPAFFSSGVRARNLELARIVVSMAAGAGDSPEWLKERYEVYSREDCFHTERLRHFLTEAEQREFQPRHFFGNCKKDLRVIHYGREAYRELRERTLRDPSLLLPDPPKDAALLAGVVLVDEDPSYLFPGQEKNLLLCPTYHHPHPHLANYQGEDTPTGDLDPWCNEFKQANTLFYAAGVLSRALAGKRSEDLPVPEILWREQGYLWFDPTRCLPRYPIDYFTEGRQVLRGYNSELNFAVAAEKPGASPPAG